MIAMTTSSSMSVKPLSCFSGAGFSHLGLQTEEGMVNKENEDHHTTT